MPRSVRIKGQKLQWWLVTAMLTSKASERFKLQLPFFVYKLNVTDAVLAAQQLIETFDFGGLKQLLKDPDDLQCAIGPVIPIDNRKVSTVRPFLTAFWIPDWPQVHQDIKKDRERRVGETNRLIQVLIDKLADHPQLLGVIEHLKSLMSEMAGDQEPEQILRNSYRYFNDLPRPHHRELNMPGDSGAFHTMTDDIVL